MAKGVGGSSADNELARLRSWNSPHALPISEGEHLGRLNKARRLTAELGADALFVNAGASLRYFTGVDWSRSERLVALLLPVHGMPLMVCPHFELGSLEAALAVEADISAWEEDEDPFDLIDQFMRECSGELLAVDPQAPLWTTARLMRTGAYNMVEASKVIDGCRMYKSPAELALMTKAKTMTLEVQRSIARILKEGITTTEVHRFLDEAHRAVGAAGSSFRIVQFGLSTTFMHANPEELRLQEGDIVLIDTGCSVEGYNSDITRTYVFGEPSPKQRSVWEIEHEAQQRAFDAAQPGRSCEQVDAAARSFLESAGFGPDYRLPGLPHRTGHGIGLELHEAAYLVRGNKTSLAAGMCFSNEPMIVIPGEFGIRLEDHFYMTDEGPRWFTTPPPSIDDPLG